MKTSLKKLTSVFLAVLMVISVFSVIGVAAADTNKTAAGGSSFKFTDNQGWGSVYVYCWDESGTGIGGEWPGVPGNSPEQNGFGETFFTIDVPDGAVGCVVNNGNGAQTTDITDFSAEGYYTDGSKDGDGHFVAIPWPGGDGGEGGGEGGGEWSGGEGGGGTGGEGYNPGPGNGPYTVVLDASAATNTGYVDWRAWTWSDGNEGYWVGATGTTAADITYVGLEDNVVFAYFTAGSDDGWGGKIGQTDDLRVDGSTFTLSSANPGDKGSVVGSWSGEKTGGGGDEYPTGGEISGSYTVSVKPGEYAADGEWYAYTWSGGPGTWVSGSESNGVYTFSGITDNVIFASASGYPDADWGNCAAQTGDLTATNGATYVISSKREPVAENKEMRPIYEGEWEEGGNIDQPTDPVTDPVITTDPVTEPATDPVTEPVITTDPVTDPVTEPATTPVETPTEAPTQPGETGLKITTALNGATINTIDCKGTSVTVTYNMQAPMLLEDGQGTLKYDASKLQITSFTLPNVTEGLIANYKVPGEAYFNFTGVDSMTESGKFNFKDNKALLVATFSVVGAGSTTVNLDMEELDGYENGQQVSYYTNKAASAQAATITESLKQTNVDVQGGDEPTTPVDNPTDAPTEAPTQTPTQAPTIAPTSAPVVEPTSAPTDETKPTTPKAKATKKTNTLKVKAKKTVKVKFSKLNKKAQKIKISKLLKITKAKGKLTYAKVKKGSKLKKFYKKFKIAKKSGKLTIKKGVKKGTYKIKIKVTAAGNKNYKKKSISKVAKIKIK